MNGTVSFTFIDTSKTFLLLKINTVNHNFSLFCRMFINYFKRLWSQSIGLNRIETCDDLNFYYKNFLQKLSRQCLKMFLPFLSLIYLFPLFVVRLILHPSIFDIRLNIELLLVFYTLLLSFFARLNLKWRKIWILIRSSFIVLLFLPIILAYRTEQEHLCFATASIIICYSSFTFSFFKSFLISLLISFVQISLFVREIYRTDWSYSDLLIIVSYHLIVHLVGLNFYVSTIANIRQNFEDYKKNLCEKNRVDVDCRKLDTLLNYCKQTSPSVAESKWVLLTE